MVHCTHGRIKLNVYRQLIIVFVDGASTCSKVCVFICLYVSVSSSLSVYECAFVRSLFVLPAIISIYWSAGSLRSYSDPHGRVATHTPVVLLLLSWRRARRRAYSLWSASRVESSRVELSGASLSWDRMQFNEATSLNIDSHHWLRDDDMQRFRKFEPLDGWIMHALSYNCNGLSDWVHRSRYTATMLATLSAAISL